MKQLESIRNEVEQMRQGIIAESSLTPDFERNKQRIHNLEDKHKQYIDLLNREETQWTVYIESTVRNTANLSSFEFEQKVHSTTLFESRDARLRKSRRLSLK